MVEYRVAVVTPAGGSVELGTVEAASEAEALSRSQDLVDMFYPLDEGWTVPIGEYRNG